MTILYYKNRWKLYELINKMKKGRFRLIRFLMGWSESKTKRHLDNLVKEGLIKEEDGIYYPTPYTELINWDEMSPTTPYKPL